tara:strand:- start:107 stop:406 length:300 start_codon:yes stop_codon:yes gene_type:complete
MDKGMVLGKLDYFARVEMLRRDHLIDEGFPGISYHEKNRRMEQMNNQQFTHNFSEVLVRRMLHEKKVSNFNIGGKLVYISDPITIKELENKIEKNGRTK